jgi:MFS family permease
MLKRSISLARNSKAISFLMIFGISMAFILQAPNMFWQPFFGSDLGNSKQLSILWVGVMISLIIGGKLAPILRKKMNCEKKSLIVLGIFTGIGIIIMSATSFLGIMLSGFILHEITRAMSNPIRTKYLNENTPSKERATVSSVESAFRVIGSSFGLIFFGLLVEVSGYAQTLLFSGTILILISLVLFFRNGFKRMPNKEFASEEIT